MSQQEGAPAALTGAVEILWDTWGVPHIFAPDEATLAYGFGWAQMHSHGDLILRLYAQARGRAAEVFGVEFLESDRYVRTVGIPQRAVAWLEAQPAGIRRILDAFAAGMNDYAAQHADGISSDFRAVLPVSSVDVVAHTHRVVHFTFVTWAADAPLELWRGQPGSNGWAIGPRHSANGNAMLLGNPHLPWADLFLFYEAHFNLPSLNFYGASLVGFPGMAMGFNDHLGWTHTVNTYDGADLYELRLADGGYLLDGEVHQFETEEQMVGVREADGSRRQEPLTIRRSRHGPVVAEGGGRALALRVAGLDRAGMLAQWWDMMQATDLAEFEGVLQQLQEPMFTVLYADREGNILLLFNALLPVRLAGDFYDWFGILPGDTSQTLWTAYHPYQDLPRTLNPPSGWLQNTNDPPWYATIPYPLDPNDFAAYTSPSGGMAGIDPFRAQRSLRMLLENQPLTFDRMVACKFSARSELADRVLDDLVAAAQRSDRELAKQAASVLARWDRAYNADSRGALLFAMWVRAYQEVHRERVAQSAADLKAALVAEATLWDDLFAEKWDAAAEPLATPRRLAEPEWAVALLERAAAELLEHGVALDVPWGQVVRMRVGDHDLPASGGPGTDTFRNAFPGPFSDGTRQVVAGDTFVYAVEFSDPIRASVLMTYGNATQPGSPHVGDQLELYARNEMRPVWRARAEIEAHLESRETLRYKE